MIFYFRLLLRRKSLFFNANAFLAVHPSIRNEILEYLDRAFLRDPEEARLYNDEVSKRLGHSQIVSILIFFLATRIKLRFIQIREGLNVDLGRRAKVLLLCP